MAFSRQYDYLKNGYENSDDTDWSKVGAAVAYPFSQIKKGATDIDPLLQLGLVNAIWGDNSVLSMYNANIQAEKNREAQQAYDAYWKNKENEQDLALQRAQRLKEVNEARVRLASLQKEYLEGGNAVKAIKAKEIDALLEEYPELGSNNSEEMSKAINDDTLAVADAEKFLAKVPNKFDSIKARDKWIADNQADIDALDPVYQKKVWEKIGGKTQAEQDAETQHNSNLNYGISKRQKEQDEKNENDKKQKALADAGRKAMAAKPPRRPTRAQQAAINAGY